MAVVIETLIAAFLCFAFPIFWCLCKIVICAAVEQAPQAAAGLCAFWFSSHLRNFQMSQIDNVQVLGRWLFPD